MRHADLIIRAASHEDLDPLSRLLVQLYAFELPGMLRGSRDAQAKVARRLLASAPLGRRYVLERDGEVVAMGGLATREAPRPSTPASALLSIPTVMGPADAARSLFGAVRGVLTIAPPPPPDAAQIHSVVVDDGARGQGHGARLMDHLESEAVREGKTRAVLQVVASNEGARAFYRGRGYADDGPAHGRVRDALAYSSVLMHKDL